MQVKALEVGLTDIHAHDVGSDDDDCDSSQQLSSEGLRALAEQSLPDVTSAMGSRHLMQQLVNLNSDDGAQKQPECAFCGRF